MATKRGLPPGFDLDVPTPVREKPVQLGDYLDELESPPPARPAKKPEVVEEKRSDGPEASNADAIEVPTLGEPATTEHQPKQAPRRRRKPKGPSRKQVNMVPETVRMIEELIDHVQEFSGQKDAKGSEVFHGLVLALYEARENIDLSEVPGRGRWGTPTAKAFPIALKNAFQEAIATTFKKNRR